MNRTAIKVNKEPNPISNTNVLSKFLFWWTKEVFKNGLKRPLDEHETYKVRHSLNSRTLSDKFTQYWEDELKTSKPSVIRFLFKFYGLRVILVGFLYALGSSAMRVVQPLCLGKMVSYFSPGQTEITKNDACLYAGGIVIATLYQVVSYHPFFFYVFQIGAKIRIGCAGLMYKKIMKLSKASINEGLTGKVINILSNDLIRFELGMTFVHDLWRGPLELATFTFLIHREIGTAGFIGMAFLLSFIPLQMWIGRKAAQYRLSAAKRTDFRVKIMNEIILGIQVIKMYTWEKSFAIMVDKIRRKEINAVRGSSYIRAGIVSFGISARISVFLSLVSFTLFGNVITASKVYIISSFLDLLNRSMVYFWPVALASTAECYIAAKRLQEFLLISEDKPNALTIYENNLQRLNINKEDNKSVDNNIGVEHSEKLSRRILNSDESKGIEMKNATALWEISENPVVGLGAVNLKIGANELCAIVGQVGSGKSTLLQVILGELELDDGLITINGKLSYAAQEPWLFEGSIKSNILFVDDFDEKRYKEVVRVCALDKDFRLLPNGDATIVGERGISLSGGQKARVNLARAIYKNADIYLLDDPLSAVDTHVGKHIFDECIRFFLKDKICILVTHQLQYLKDVKHVVLMNQGRIEGQGSYEDVQRIASDSLLSIQPTSKMEKEKEECRRKSEGQTSIKNTPICTLEDDMKNRQETQTVGAVSLDVYKSFFKSVESKPLLVVLVGFFILAQFSVSGVDYFVSQWVNWEETVAEKENVTEENSNSDTTSHREIYVIVYSVIILLATYLFVHRTFAFFKMCLMASINLHDRLFRGITRAKMYFYNTNPSGRILNRFSRDINSIDTLLPPAFMDGLAFILEFVAVLILIAIANYWLIFPTAIMMLLLYGIRYVYLKTGRCVKRIDSLTRSPIYSHTNATFQGLTSIRVFKAQSMLENEFHEHMDHNTSAWFISAATTRAFALWMDIICCLYITTVAFSFLVLDTDSGSGNVGLAILQSIGLIGMCQWGMRQTAEIESQMTSVERVLEYADLPTEPPLQSISKYQPPSDWPHSGKIIFSDLSFQYSENTNFVLKNLHFQISPKEKIGIVGRTGAGKSSLIQALFRLADLDGSIYIDGLEINNLGLHDLRRKISIIPQDPVLFSGTLRFNLDPFDEKKDDELWNALAQVELKPVIASLAGGLDCKMSDGGSNLSMGQRQLVCLARAVLRNNKILILDEATANVDPETDKLIQTTIRNQFSDCTVLTIAHRLHTVMDSDRVLVIEAGQAVEFDHPHTLLQLNNGYFRQLVDQTGPLTASVLSKAALKSFQLKKIQTNS